MIPLNYCKMFRTVLLISVLVISSVLARDFEYGQRTSTDRLVKEESVYVKMGFLRHVYGSFSYTAVSGLRFVVLWRLFAHLDSFRQFPPQPQGNFITFVKIVDLAPFKSSGTVGLAKRYENNQTVAVTANFKSLFNLCIWVRVRVYADYELHF